MPPDTETTSPRPAGEPRQVAIVGLNRETSLLLPSLLDSDGIQVIKILNPDMEDLCRLTQYPQLSIVIDTTQNASIAARLRKLPLRKVDVISGLGARILFCSLRPGGAPVEDAEGGKGGFLRSLEEIREAVCLTKNKEEILRVILNTAVKSAGADCGSLMLLDPSRRQLTIAAAHGLDEKVVIASIQRVGKGVSGIAVRRGEPILIQGAVDERAYAADYHKPEIVSSICCPLMFGGEAVGVINIASKNPRRVFGSTDVDFLVELAALAAEVIKTSRDGESNQHTAQAMGLLNSVREILAMKYRFEERLNLLLMKMANVLSADVCTYYEYNPVDRNFLAKASSSIGLGGLKERPLPLDDFFAQRIIKTGATFCVNAAGKTPRGKKWYLLQPIRAGAGLELSGTLLLCLESEKNHLKEEVALLRRIGELLTRELSRNRELEAIKAQSLKYSAISQFSFDVANTETLPEMAKMILSNIRLILEAETCVLRLRNPVSGALDVCESHSLRNPAWLREILAVDEAVASDMEPGRGIVRIEDLGRTRYGTGGVATASVLAMAMELDGEIIGTLSLYGKKSLDPSLGNAFSDQDKEILQDFSLQAFKGLKRFHPFPSPIPQEIALAG